MQKIHESNNLSFLFLTFKIKKTYFLPTIQQFQHPINIKTNKASAPSTHNINEINLSKTIALN